MNKLFSKFFKEKVVEKMIFESQSFIESSFQNNVNIYMQLYACILYLHVPHAAALVAAD